MPPVAKPLEAIYVALDRFSMEDGTPAAFPVLPPLRIEGDMLKGILLASKLEWLKAHFPEIPDLFHTVVGSQWCSYAANRECDGLQTPYDNSHRERWFRRQYPERNRQVIVPAHEADWTNEEAFRPPLTGNKDIDLLCVSRLLPFKKLPMLARTLAAYHRKYRKLVATIPWGDPQPLNARRRACYRKLEETFRWLGCTLEDYIRFVPRRSHRQMPALYGRARAYVLFSLIEGKNRSLHEAMLCDVPVICCRQHNQYARGNVEVFPPGAGLYAETFDPEAFAVAIHEVLSRPEAFTPRRAYLEHADFRGRWQVLNRCVDRFAYYASRLPGFERGRHHLNPWLNTAITEQYGISLHDYVYSGLHGVSDGFGDPIALHAIEEVIMKFSAHASASRWM